MRLPILLVLTALALSIRPDAAAGESRISSSPATEVHLSAATYSVAENDPAGVATITLVATGGTSGLVDLHTSEGTARGGPPGLPGLPGGISSDYINVATTVTLTGANTNVSIALNDDVAGEDAETFTVTLSLTGGLGAVPVIGSPSTATVTITDNDPPGVTLGSSANRHAETSVVVYLGFSETVDGFTAGDLLVTNATVAGVVASNATNYEITLTGMADGATVTVALPANAITDRDLAPHGNALASHSFVVDRTGPACTVSAGPGPTTTSPITFIVAFNEELKQTGAPAPLENLTVNNGTVQSGSFFPIGATPSVSVTVMPAHSGTVTLTVPAGWVEDAAGNPVAATSGSIDFIDNIPPTVTSVTTSVPNGNYGHGSTIPITLNFSEPVTLVGSMNLVLNNNGSVTFPAFTGTSVSGVYTVGGGPTVVVADLDSSTLTLNGVATLRDASGNNANLGVAGGNSLGTTHNLAIVDLTPATYAVTTTHAAGTFGPHDGSGPITLTLTFSKPVTFSGHGIGILLNARASAMPALVNIGAVLPPPPASVWMADYIIADDDSAALLAVTTFVPEPMSALIDADGLTLTPGPPVTNLSPAKAIVIDGVGPTVTSLSAVGSTTTSPIHLAVTLSEASTDFAMGDITVTGVGGTLSNFTGSGTSYTADITPTAAGVVTLQIGAGQFHDAHANPNVAKSVNLTYAPAGGSGSAPADSSGAAGGCGLGSGVGALALLGVAMLMVGFRRRG